MATYTIKHYCEFCRTEKIFTYQGKVQHKDDMYYFECDKGHPLEKYIPENLRKAIGIDS